MLPDTPSEPRPDSGPDLGADVPDVMTCNQPRAMCMPQVPSGTCDPYCQSGCGCQERCVANTAGAPNCVAPLPGNFVAGQQCVVASSGLSTQTDACGPGLVCIREACTATAHCFAYCRSDADCPNSTCSRPGNDMMGNPGGFKVCELSFSDCDPLQPNIRCPMDKPSCYLSAVAPDKTFCACPKGVREFNDCVTTSDCFQGLTCAVDDTGARTCRRVCKMAGAPCDGTAKCRSLNGSQIFGFCL